MKKSQIDLRKFSRVFFSIKDHVEGKIVVAADQLVPVRFVNLSEGGIAFVCNRIQASHFLKDQIVALKPPRTGLLAFLGEAECEVKYVLTVECIPLATIGCEFTTLSDAARDKIRKIVGRKSISDGS